MPKGYCKSLLSVVYTIQTLKILNISEVLQAINSE